MEMLETAAILAVVLGFFWDLRARQKSTQELVAKISSAMDKAEERAQVRHEEMMKAIRENAEFNRKEHKELLGMQIRFDERSGKKT